MHQTLSAVEACNPLFTWNCVDFSGFCDHGAVQSCVWYLSLNCESCSDNFSLSLPAQCLSPRWWLLWSCHICYSGYCSGTSHYVAALLSTLLDSKWLCFSAFVPVAGVWELWFDTGSFIGCFGKATLWDGLWTDVFDIPLEEGNEGSNSFQRWQLRNIRVLHDCCPLSFTSNVAALSWAGKWATLNRYIETTKKSSEQLTGRRVFCSWFQPCFGKRT